MGVRFRSAARVGQRVMSVCSSTVLIVSTVWCLLALDCALGLGAWLFCTDLRRARTEAAAVPLLPALRRFWSGVEWVVGVRLLLCRQHGKLSCAGVAMYVFPKDACV